MVSTRSHPGLVGEPAEVPGGRNSCGSGVLGRDQHTVDHVGDELAEKLGRTMHATYGLLKRIRQGLRNCVERKLEAEAAR